MLRYVLLVSSALAFAPAAAPAQVAKGQYMEAPNLSGIQNSGARTIAEFVGRTVLYEYFSIALQPCALSVPHFNRLNSKYSELGLTLLGVTNEPRGDVFPWAEEQEIKYAYAYDSDKSFWRSLGSPKLPYAVLVGPTGKVAFAGDAQRLSQEVIEFAITDALKTPLWKLPQDYVKVQDAVVAGDFGTALKEAQALQASKAPPQDIATVVKALESIQEGFLIGAERLCAKGDWLGAQEAYERIVKSSAGLPAEKTARQKLAMIRDGVEQGRAVKAQKRLREILAMPTLTAEDKQKRDDELRNFIQHAESAFAKKQAEDALKNPPKKS